AYSLALAQSGVGEAGLPPHPPISRLAESPLQRPLDGIALVEGEVGSALRERRRNFANGAGLDEALNRVGHDDGHEGSSGEVTAGRCATRAATDESTAAAPSATTRSASGSCGVGVRFTMTSRA